MSRGRPAEAGLRPGDVLLRAGRRDLLSVARLYAAIDDAEASGRLRIKVPRGVAEQHSTVRLAVRPAKALLNGPPSARLAVDAHVP